jgi:hypothetical protein
LKEAWGRDAQTAIIKGSTGIGMIMDSKNEKSPKKGIAHLFCASPVHKL